MLNLRFRLVHSIGEVSKLKLSKTDEDSCITDFTTWISKGVGAWDISTKFGHKVVLNLLMLQNLFQLFWKYSGVYGFIDEAIKTHLKCCLQCADMEATEVDTTNDATEMEATEETDS